jgi:integrase
VRGYLAFLGTSDPEAFEGRDPLADPHGRNYAVREFLTHLQTVQQAKPTTIKSYHAALDHLYSYHLDLGRAVAARERIPRWAPRALEPLERKKFLRACERCKSTRDTAIALTLSFSGLRISELAALNLDDIVRSARRCKIIISGTGKGGVYRTVPGLHPLARTAIDAWLTNRAASSRPSGRCSSAAAGNGSATADSATS